ncbi:unnamed protein product, partial [Rotaria sordida]
HTASVLVNGKVLVTGGYNSGGSVNSPELYDPSTGMWTNISSMSTSRYPHTASVLVNGKVLVAGGLNDGVSMNSAELYQP